MQLMKHDLKRKQIEVRNVVRLAAILIDELHAVEMTSSDILGPRRLILICRNAAGKAKLPE
jgi:hypothetical protein